MTAPNFDAINHAEASIEAAVETLIGSAMRALLIPHLPELARLHPVGHAYLTSGHNLPASCWVSTFLAIGETNGQPDRYKLAVSADLFSAMDRIIRAESDMYGSVAQALAILYPTPTETTP